MSPESERLSVAVVDSGVFAGHPHLAGIPVSGFGVVGVEPPFRREEAFDDRTGHGTAAAAAIAWSEPRVSILAVRVLDAELRTTSAALAEAIVGAADAGASVINLSLGSTRDESRSMLAEAVAYASASGAVCVANAHPRGRSLWPGDLPTVISATSHRDCPRADLFTVRGLLPRFVAHGFPRPVEGRAPTDNFFGPSFACAHVTAAVVSLLQRSPGLEFGGVVEALEARANGEVDP